jgi:hypothetical protein
MRLHSSALNLSSLIIDKPELPKPAKAPERRVHKMTMPVPLGGLNKEQARTPGVPMATTGNPR